MIGWRFPLNNGGSIDGLNDAGIETFQGEPTKSLAREVIQNSLDAAKENSGPVQVEFKLKNIPKNEFPELDYFKKTLKKCLDYWDEIEKAEKFFENSIEVINQEEIPVLKIGDYNTTGLTGSKGSEKSRWFSLTKGDGVSDKQTGAGGSFGIGKQAPFTCSDLRTVFYSTKDKEENKALQGVAKLVTHETPNGEKTQGTGYFGKKEGNKPIFDWSEIEFCDERKESGTDIYVMGFNHTNRWKEKIITSILEHFFAAIYNKALIVKVSDILITAENLEEMMVKYIKSDNSEYYADKYLESMLSEDHHLFEEENFEGLGKIKMYLLPKKGFPKKVAMVRSTGMKIFDKGHFLTPLKFAGVFLAEGREINEFLRKLEPPSHNKWEPNRHPDVKYAERIRGKLYSWINDKVKSITVDEEAEKVDVDGMSQYLPDEVDEFPVPDEEAGEEDIEESLQNTEPKKIDVEEEITDLNPGREAEEVDDGREGSDDGSPGDDQQGGRGGRYDPGDVDEGSGGGRGSGDDEDNPTVSNRPLKLKDSKVFCLNPDQGIYLASLVPNRAGEVYIKLNIAGEDINSPADINMAKFEGTNGEEIEVDEGKIGPFKLDENGNNIIIKLDEGLRFALEVDIYEN